MLTALLAILVSARGAGQEACPPEVAGFRYESGRLPVGRVYRYAKSNLDGSNPTEIALHLAGEAQIEVLKWSRGEPEATLVVAEMDWDTCSVSTFHTYHVDAHGGRTLQAALVTSPDRKRVDVQVGAQRLTCPLERFPWHSYDFDFSSLNVALRFLTDPTGETEFEIVDFVHAASGPEFVDKGGVVLAYESVEERAGVDCRRYVIDGPGLEDRGGSLWVAQGDDVFLVAFEIDLPDEPGMSSGKLQWQRNETMSATEWEAFVRAQGATEPR